MNKPDPYLVLSVGKKSEQTAVQMRTDSPVWEQGFTFLVANPGNDTLHVRIIDQKTEKELGTFTYALSGLLEQTSLEVGSQPFQLAKSGAESKITMSMCLRILKNTAFATEAPQVTPPLTSNIDDNFSRTSSVRQTGSEESPLLSALRKQDSRVSRQSNDTDSGMIADEHVLASSSVTQLSSSPIGSDSSSEIGESHLIHRTPSVTSSAGSAGLGRIQLTLRYSAQRQRLIVIIHKIM